MQIASQLLKNDKIETDFLTKNIIMKQLKFLIPSLLIICMTILLASCETNSKQKIDHTKTDSISAEFKKERTDFREKIDREINNIDKELERIDRKISNRADNVGEDIEQEWKETKIALQEAKDEMQRKAVDIESKTEKEWEEFKSDLEETMEDTQDVFKTFGERIEDVFAPNR